MNERQTYVCKRTRIAAYLIGRGFLPYKIVPDRDNPVFSVYLFTATPELYKAVMEYVTHNNFKNEGIRNEKTVESTTE